MTLTRALCASAFFAAGLAHAVTITGTVSDRTTNKVAAGDTVVLIGFGQGMQEVARTTTDAHGRYSIQAPDEAAGGGGGAAAGTHLIRVDHQKATYFQPAPPGAHTVDVDVYDVSEAVKGISTEADVLSMQTGQDGLHVVENYFVRNDSKPPMTQFSRHAYEIYLPAGAKIEASAAAGPAGMPVASSPIPLGDPDHYAFVFPIRPGETRFQISYRLPYSGNLAFTQREALPTENFVVMLPKAMQFSPKGASFQTVPDNGAAQTFVDKGVKAAQPVEFTVAGTGQMPREAQQGDTAAAAQPDQNAGADNRPGGGLGPPIDTPDPLNKYKWWLLSALALVMVAVAAWLLRKPRTESAGTLPGKPGKKTAVPAALRPTAPPKPAQARAEAVKAGAASGGLLGALKDALFALEAERLSGQTSEAEYQKLKASLEVVLRQALDRESVRP
jgi:hypothetical protein